MDNLSVDTDRAQVKQEIHRALKKYFEIESLRDLTTENLYLYIQFIRMIFAREFGILLKKPGEPEDIQNMDMKQFLKYQ